MEDRNGFHYRWYTKLIRKYRFSSLSLPLMNPVIRVLLWSWYIAQKSRYSIIYRGRTSEITEKLASEKLFFGFAVSRSGTSFLSALLNSQPGQTTVVHEANVLDFLHFQDALRSETDAVEYISKYRIYDLYRRVMSSPGMIYGEISPHLRQHCHGLKSILPKALLFHLVRDGKKVVSSLMARGRLSKKDPILYDLKPPPSDPYCSEWESMSRFERICWLWQRDNSYLRRNTGNTVKFENILSDYSYFKNALLDYLGLAIDESDWRGYVNRPVNVTPTSHQMKWENWSPENRSQFRRICGAEMCEYGYSVD